MKTLDHWDCRIIRAFKHSKPDTIAQVKLIWKERCNLSLEYVRLRDINDHLLSLAWRLGLFDEWGFKAFILDLDHEKNFFFHAEGNPVEGKNFHRILFSRLGSFFALTLVKKLPGYKEYIEKNPA